MTEDEERELFYKSYKPTWKLQKFTHPVWQVEYSFDDNGPTEAEFEPVFEVVGSYLKLTREEFAFRMDGCCGFSIGQPCTAPQMKALQDAGIRISSKTIQPGECLILTDFGRYWFADAALHEEFVVWMLSQGAETEITSIE